MSYPILYSATETNFDHNGIGILSACVSCEVTEEANGIFELAMTYPMDGVHFAEIGDRAIIKAKADQFREPQLFRVYAISKPMNSIVTVWAEHISYDLSGIPVKPFTASTVSSALTGLKNNAVVDCPFDFLTDKATTAKFSVKTPASIRSRLGGVAGSILDVYGGEYEFDNYTVKLHNNRGMNRGVFIRYGKNLTDIKQDQNCSSVATGVYPYWVSQENGELLELPEKIINAPGTYNFVKIRTVDFSQNFEEKPTEEQLRKATENYIKNNNIGIPKVSLTVSFAQLEQTEEYRHLKLLERVSLFDTVSVKFPLLGVSATAKAVKVVYDVVADRVKSVTLGSVRANIADTIASQQQEIQNKPNKSFMELAIERLTKTILGAKGGSVRLLDTDGDGEPDTLYIADNPDPTQAVKVWRFNYEGWGASQNGYGGPFEMGATFNDGIIADFITAGTLRGLNIESLDGKIQIGLGENSSEPIFNTGISTNGLNIRADEVGAETLFSVDVYQNKHGKKPYYGAVNLNSTTGNRIFRAVETFSANEKDKSVGGAVQLLSQDGSSKATIATGEGFSSIDLESGASADCWIQANGDVAGIGLVHNGSLAAGFQVDSYGESSLVTLKLNGKTLGWRNNNDGTYTLIGQ